MRRNFNFSIKSSQKPTPSDDDDDEKEKRKLYEKKRRENLTQAFDDLKQVLERFNYKNLDSRQVVIKKAIEGLSLIEEKRKKKNEDWLSSSIGDVPGLVDLVSIFFKSFGLSLPSFAFQRVHTPSIDVNTCRSCNHCQGMSLGYYHAGTLR